MTRRMTLALVLALGLLLAPSVALDAQAQQPPKPVADTGVVTPGTNQLLRITVVAGLRVGDVGVRFRRMEYLDGPCSGDTGGAGVCTHTLTSQTLSAPVMLMPGEAASIDIVNNGNSAVRAMVFSDNPHVRVNAMIVDMTSGDIIAWLTLHNAGPSSN